MTPKTFTNGDIEIDVHAEAVIVRNKRSKASIAFSRDEARRLTALLNEIKD